MALTQVSTGGVKDGTLLNADVNAAASIAGTKVSPNFGSQNIFTTGNVGIGTTSPSAKLSVVEAASTNSAHIKMGTSTNQNVHLELENDGSADIRFGCFGSSASTFGNITANNGFIHTTNDLSINAASSTGNVKIGTGATPSTKLFVKNDGKVGIGTTSPDTLLHLAGADTAVIRLENTDTTLGTDQIIGGIEFEKQDPTGAGVGIAGAIRLKSMSSVGQAASMFFSTSNSSGNDQTKMTLDFDGKVGIGTISPTTRFTIVQSANDSTGGLSIFDSTANSSFRIFRTGAGAGSVVSLQDRGTDVINIKDQQIGIGTTSPTSAGSYTKFVQISDDNSASVAISRSASGSAHTFELGAFNGASLIESTGATSLRFKINGSNAMGIDSNRRVGIGTITPSVLAHIRDSTNNGSSLEQFRISGGNRTADSFETGFRFFTESPSANGNRHIRFTSNGNTGLTIQPMETSTGNAAGDRNISLCPDGGNVGIGTTNPQADLHIASASPFIRFTDTVDDSHYAHIGHTDGSIFIIDADAANAHAGSGIQFKVDNNSVMFLEDSGHVGIGLTNPASLLHVSSSTTSYFRFQDLASETIGLIIRKNITATSYTALDFRNGNGPSGTLSVSTGSVSLANASDYRLKENETVISDGITKIKQLIPRRFNFKKDPTNTLDGFFAHEVSGVVPEAVIGEKDATIDEDGNGYQQLDATKLIPILTAALKEAIAKVEALETEVATLKAS